jgi:DMSO reductase anchor subunit
LLAWLGLHAAMQPQGMPRVAMLIGLGFGVVLVSIGLIASLWHLGKPKRAWRAFSQWRTSWLSREGVAAVVTYLPALILVGATWFRIDGWIVRGASFLLTAMALLTVACTAMIYASLPPIAAWRDRAVLPVYLAYALLGGMLWCALLLSLFGWRPQLMEIAPMILLAFGLAALKLNYWHRIDSQRGPSAADATGLRAFGEVQTFERPNTETNYLLSEMGFVLARRHARRLRSFALLIGLALPFTLLLLAAGWPLFSPWLIALGAIAFQLGAMAERWLFFAQARHTVMLYYGDGQR